MTAALGVLATALALGLSICAAVSAGISLAWPLVHARIARWHAVDRGRAVGALLAAPIALPALLVAIALAPGLIGLAIPGLDHCSRHPEHPHLCLAHATAVLPRLVVASLAAASFVACMLTLRRAKRATARARPLQALAQQSARRLAPRVDLVDSDVPIACTHGLLRPRALVSTRLANDLRADQMAAVIAHEREHARRRDPLRALLASLAACALWPRARQAALAAFTLSAEQACDERAAEAVGDRVLVAETILAVERLLARHPTSTTPAAAGIDGGPVALRVESLLSAPRRSHRLGLALALALGLLTVVAAEPIHHEMEHLLAWVLRAV